MNEESPIPELHNAEQTFFVWMNGAASGPYPMSQVKDFIKMGVVTFDTSYSLDGINDWRKLGTIPELAPRHPANIQFVINPEKQSILIKYRKSRFIYGLLGLLLGFLGIHNFYAGRYKQARIMLLMWPLFFVFVAFIGDYGRRNNSDPVLYFGLAMLAVGYISMISWVIYEIIWVKADSEGDPFS